MGWASGSGLAEDLWRDLKNIIPREQWREAVGIIFDSFSGWDCDTLDECQGMLEDAGIVRPEEHEEVDEDGEYIWWVEEDTREPWRHG